MVLAMLGFIAAATVLFSLGFLQNANLHTEESNLVSLLKRVRSDSMNNIGGVVHGIALDPRGIPEYVLFSGNSYVQANAATFESIPRASNYSFATTSLREIVFSQLSGAIAQEGSITLIDTNQPAASTTIFVNYEGTLY